MAPFTLAGFGEDIDPAGVFVNVAGLADAHLFVEGDRVRVPTLNRMIGVFAGLALGGTDVARFESPSLRDVNRLRIAPINGNLDADIEPDDPPAVMDMRMGPRTLKVDEQLELFINTNPAAVAFQWGFVLFADAVPTPVTGEIVTVRLTGTTTQVARVWSTVVLTFDDVLPTGDYQIVGMRMEGASAIAARIVFKPGTWRPGCIAGDTAEGLDHPMFRMGQLGNWGEFTQTQPPDVEVVSNLADTAQTVYWDLIKIS